jgi:hypothetical protein
MGRLRRADDLAAFAEEIAFNRVRRDEDVRRFGVEMILGRAEEAKSLFRDFKIAGTGFLSVFFSVFFAHTNFSVIEDFENTRNFER